MASLVAERLRQQAKAKTQKKNNIAGPAGRIEKEIGFEQFGRCLSLQSATKAVREDSGFDIHRRSLSIQSIAESNQSSEAGFDMYSRSLSIESNPGSKEKKEGFEMYRRSLGIKSSSMKKDLELNFGRSQSDIGSIAEAAKKDAGPTMFRRSLTDDTECKSAKTKQPSRQQSLMSSSKPRTLKTPKAVKDALAKMTSMFKSTEEQCSSARDDDEFSHSSTEAGAYADEGPFDSVRIVLH